MTPEQTRVLAAVDQQSAQANAAIEELVSSMRAVLADGSDPGVVAVLIAGLMADETRERLAEMFGYAVVRLAQAPDLGEVPDGQ